MLGDFINRCLILLLGYAYPGFECYKIVEKNRVDIEELRFWCKYWIIVALFTVLEKFADIFVGWLPMYGEMKLVFFIYMWYPKTKGTAYVYETLLRPLVSRHENDIDRKILECKARAWDYIAFNWQYCAQFGQTAFVQALQYVVSQSTKISSNPTTQKKDVQGQDAPQLTSIQSSFKMKQSSSLSKSKKMPATPPSTPSSIIHRNISGTPKSKTVEVHLDSQKEYLEEEEEEEEKEALESEPATTEEGLHTSVRDRINRARARLRRLETQNSRTPRTPQRQEQ